MKPGDKVVCVWPDYEGDLSLLKVYEITQVLTGYPITSLDNSRKRIRLKHFDSQVFFPSRFILIEPPVDLQTQETKDS